MFSFSQPKSDFARALAAASVTALLACGATAERNMSSVELPVGMDTIPSITAGACEDGECHVFNPAVACRAVKLQPSPSNAATAGAFKPGDTVDVRTDLHLRKPGIVVLKRDYAVRDQQNTGATTSSPLQIPAGDTLLLLSYSGQGLWKASYRGRLLEVLEFWGGPGQANMGPDDSAQAAIALGTAPVIDTWLRISRPGLVNSWWMRDSAISVIPVDEYGERFGYRCFGAPSSR